jgi:hypothetical protein
MRLPGEAVENIHELAELTALFRFTLGNAVRDAPFDVKLEDRQADPVERGLGRRPLLKELDAHTRLLHHPPDASNLTFDAVQARHERLLLRVIQHSRTCILRLGFGSERYLRKSTVLRRFSVVDSANPPHTAGMRGGIDSGV